MKILAMNEVFEDYRFVKPLAGHYAVSDGWYPLLGLPGAIDIRRRAALFCRLRTSVETEVQKFCLNGVIEKIRIHRSARVNGPDTMLVLASDLMREFEVCQVPMMSDTEAKELADAHAG